MPSQTQINISNNNVNTRHLRAGDEEPKVDPERITVYNMRYCPFATRTILVLLKKGIEFNTVNINLSDKPDWFLRLTPVGKVPVIKHGDFVGIESAVLNDYLDEKYPDPKLSPGSPEQKVRDANLIDEAGRKYTMPYYRTMFAKDPELKSQALQDLLNAISWLNEILSKDGRGPYFAVGRGEGPGMVDYNIWPFTPMLRLFNEAGVAEIPWEKYPNFTKWLDLMDEDPAVKAYAIPKDAWLGYYRDSKEDKVDKFDRLLAIN